MIKRAEAVSDWVSTQIAGLTYSKSTEMYRIQAQTNNQSELEHVTLDREHSREHSDHEQAEVMVARLPWTLWSTGPADAGHCQWLPPITFQIQTVQPIWLPQYTQVPQGFILSPGLFNQALKEALSGCELPPDCTLIQYVDDILIAATTVADCLQATHDVLWRLHARGFKASKDKLQIARPTVKFLGRLINRQGAGMSPNHRQIILQHPQPVTVKQMLSFLGLAGFSRSYVPDFGNLTNHLREMVREKGMRNLTAPLQWTVSAEEAFTKLKQSLTGAADLASPDYALPFFLDVSVQDNVVNGVLYQKQRGRRCILMYLSVMLDPLERRHPVCTQHAAGIAKLIQKTTHIVMGHQLVILTTHSVVAFVNSQIFTLVLLRQGRLSKILEAPNLVFTHQGINVADQISGGEPHDCQEKVLEDLKIRPDLVSEPIEGAENWYTDGGCYKDKQGDLQAGYAVVRETETGYQIVRAKKLTERPSAQRAELLAMITALQHEKDREVNIYTDSAYVTGAVHVELRQWERAGYRTATMTPVKHAEEMAILAQAIPGPTRVAVIKCKRHDKEGSRVAKGNEEADQRAKEAAGYTPRHQMMMSHPQVRPREEIVIDYTDMIDRVRGYRYLLVMVDSITGWPEAYPAKNEDSKIVIKCLINHYIPQHGFPRRVRSDNGTYFKNQDLQAVKAALGLKHKFGAVYHPESQGKVERMNQNLKTKLAKICVQSKIEWVGALPIALLQIRSSLNKVTGFTPFELLTGRQFPGPTAALPGEGQNITNFQYKAYFDELKALVSGFVSQVHDRVTGGQKGEPHTAEWVRLKVIKRKWSEPRWTGPHQVVERTSHAVRLKRKGDTWYHWSQCIPAEKPGRTLQEIQTVLRGSSAGDPNKALPQTGQSNPQVESLAEVVHPQSAT
ncbi:uncharacterized protein LOC115776172 [Archocentrus centrarchus]|uniref:uncharacterized protein LOC115776172 n=1 Tax=Archocentrus centrarchus TaxID=63155 RepID=UPI0011EA13B2|nr:uncharacterized protein LOC115776172 [Archocentrus centrarchus]